MKKFKFLALSTACLALSSLTGCTTNSDNTIAQKDRLSIVYYPGGYGSEYLTDFCKSFLSQKLGKPESEIIEGTHYQLIPDDGITYGADYYLTSDARCPDIIISNLLSPKAVTQGYVANLDDVFETSVETSQGKVKLEDYVNKEAIEQYSYEIRRGQTAKHRFAMPWTAIPISIAYNDTLLHKIKHVQSDFVVGEDISVNSVWTRAPKTVEELKAIFVDVDAYNQENGTNITKLGWAAANGTNWFESFITTWWAQRQGVDEEYLYEGEGSYYDFWKYDSPEIFKQTGLQDALSTIKELFISNGQYVNSYPSVGSMTIKNAQQAFAEGKALMCLTGDFFEQEYSLFIKESQQTFKMMRVPAIDNALTNEDGSTKELTYLNISSCAYVPNKAANKELAKEFLIYTSSEANLVKFTKATGGIRPFNYDVRELAKGYEFSEFKKSVFDLYYDADDYLYKFPRNIAVEDISPIYLYEGVSEVIFLGANYATVLSSLKDLSPAQIMVEGTSSFNSIYSRAVKSFNEWKRIYGL